MWALYLKSHEGLAVQSTYQRIIDSLSEYKDFAIFIGMIQYLDYELDAIPEGNVLFPLMSKRKSFEHERELRALIWTIQHGKNFFGDENKYADIEGFYVPVKLDVLIERVYVSPASPKWVVELVWSLVNRFGLKIEVVQSGLSAPPTYY